MNSELISSIKSSPALPDNTSNNNSNNNEGANGGNTAGGTTQVKVTGVKGKRSRKIPKSEILGKNFQNNSFHFLTSTYFDRKSSKVHKSSPLSTSAPSLIISNTSMGNTSSSSTLTTHHHHHDEQASSSDHHGNLRLSKGRRSSKSKVPFKMSNRSTYPSGSGEFPLINQMFDTISISSTYSSHSNLHHSNSSPLLPSHPTPHSAMVNMNNSLSSSSPSPVNNPLVNTSSPMINNNGPVNNLVNNPNIMNNPNINMNNNMNNNSYMMMMMEGEGGYGGMNNGQAYGGNAAANPMMAGNHPMIATIINPSNPPPNANHIINWNGMMMLLNNPSSSSPYPTMINQITPCLSPTKPNLTQPSSADPIMVKQDPSLSPIGSPSDSTCNSSPLMNNNNNTNNNNTNTTMNCNMNNNMNNNNNYLSYGYPTSFIPIAYPCPPFNNGSMGNNNGAMNNNNMNNMNNANLYGNNGNLMAALNHALQNNFLPPYFANPNNINPNMNPSNTNQGNSNNVTSYPHSIPIANFTENCSVSSFIPPHFLQNLNQNQAAPIVNSNVGLYQTKSNNDGGEGLPRGSPPPSSPSHNIVNGSPIPNQHNNNGNEEYGDDGVMAMMMGMGSDHSSASSSYNQYYNQTPNASSSEESSSSSSSRANEEGALQYSKNVVTNNNVYKLIQSCNERLGQSSSAPSLHSSNHSSSPSRSSPSQSMPSHSPIAQSEGGFDASTPSSHPLNLSSGYLPQSPSAYRRFSEVLSHPVYPSDDLSSDHSSFSTRASCPSVDFTNSYHYSNAINVNANCHSSSSLNCHLNSSITPVNTNNIYNNVNSNLNTNNTGSNLINNTIHYSANETKSYNIRNGESFDDIFNATPHDLDNLDNIFQDINNNNLF